MVIILLSNIRIRKTSVVELHSFNIFVRVFLLTLMLVTIKCVIKEHDKLKTMIWKAIDEGLEGLVLKDLESVYEPGKRHWLKVAL